MIILSKFLNENQLQLVQKLGLESQLEEILKELKSQKIKAKDASLQIIDLIDKVQKNEVLKNSQNSQNNADSSLKNSDLVNSVDSKKDFSYRDFSVLTNSQSQSFGSNSKSVIDLHLGGEDHIDVHHKNEILQSEALGFELSKNWVHNKFVLVDGKKMSKSLGNVFLVNGKFADTGFYSFQNPPTEEFTTDLKIQIIKKYKELKLYDIYTKSDLLKSLPKIKLMADYQCWPIWHYDNERVGNINPQDLPISQELKSELNTWQREYDETLNQEDPVNSGFKSKIDEENWGKQRFEIWQKLKKELRFKYEVFYFSEGKIFGDDENTFWQNFKFDPLAYRLMLFEHHYTVQMDFTWEKLWQSQMRLWGIRKEAAKIVGFFNSQTDENAQKMQEKYFEELRFKEIQKKWLKILSKNLNFPDFLSEFTKELLVVSNKVAKEQGIDWILFNLLILFDKDLLQLEVVAGELMLPELQNLAKKRQKFKETKNWTKADEIRSQIQKQGWQIDDYVWGFGLWWRGDF